MQIKLNYIEIIYLYTVKKSIFNKKFHKIRKRNNDKVNNIFNYFSLIFARSSIFISIERCIFFHLNLSSKMFY